MESIVTVVSTLGFPIAACLGLAIFVVKMWERQQKQYENVITKIQESSKRREEELFVQLSKYNASLETITQTISEISIRITNIEKNN